ncbi:hypothetical protein BDW59DRAFT_165515 [Aspergillus cavernicola]|uniref:DUF7730 domain-containing protein n=1 Tax=Aspergillus cavernicola TaxID=176166 RepID=A0ABR4HUL5_9EURO
MPTLISTPTTTQKESPLLTLPPELRLQIYSHLFNIPTPYYTTTRSQTPLILINDTGNKFTTRPTYRALHISPKWVVNNTGSEGEEQEPNNNEKGGKERLALLSVNRKIHTELEDFLYTDHTLFFLNGFDLDYLGAFLSTLSPTARSCIRSIGFEIYLFIHGNGNEDRGERGMIPKRPWGSYERAAKVVKAELPNLDRVVFWLDPWFSACCGAGGGGEKSVGPWCDERSVLTRGVAFLLRAFGGVRGGMGEMKMDFLPAFAMAAVSASSMVDVRRGLSYADAKTSVPNPPHFQ